MEQATVDANDVITAISNQRTMFANESATLAAQLFAAQRRIEELERENTALKSEMPKAE